MARLIDPAQLSALTFHVETILNTALSTRHMKQRYSDEAAGHHIPICAAYVQGTCDKGINCLQRHSRGHKDEFVCKHWLRGLCKKAELCEFLHEYDLSKMPPCHFYITYGACSNEDCPFLHISARHDDEDCPQYTLQGFCAKGVHCVYKHERKVLCADYLTGFCMDGPNCTKGHHTKWLLPAQSDMPNYEHLQAAAARAYGERTHGRGIARVDINQIECNRCHELGHLAAQCPLSRLGDHAGGHTGKQVRSLDQVTCFKCGETGHYANTCTKPRTQAGAMAGERSGFAQRRVPGMQ